MGRTPLGATVDREWPRISRGTEIKWVNLLSMSSSNVLVVRRMVPRPSQGRDATAPLMPKREGETSPKTAQLIASARACGKSNPREPRHRRETAKQRENNYVSKERRPPCCVSGRGGHPHGAVKRNRYWRSLTSARQISEPRSQVVLRCLHGPLPCQAWQESH